jgi:hypothetical protein
MQVPTAGVAGGDRARWASLIPVLFIAWLNSSLFYTGELGKYSDDYFFASRDPQSGAPLVPTALSSRPFYRPLHWLLLNGAARVFWFHDRTHHSLNAIGHGISASLLLMLLRALGGLPTFVAGCVVLFLAYPAHFEVIFWPAALPSSIACRLFLISGSSSI